MEHPPEFSFTDVAWAPARALSAKQIALMTAALIGGLIAYNLFSYLALLIQGDSFSAVYSAFGFFSFEPGAYAGLIPRLVFWAGACVALYIIMLGMFAVAAINVESIRGNRFFSAREAFRFTLARAGQLARAEIAILLFVLFIVFLFFLLGLVVRIPYVGEWFYAIFFVIPNFIVALFTVFIIFVVLLSVILLPAVAAAERRGETFAVILETFSTIIRLPLRWGCYTVFTLVAAKVCSFVYAYFCFRAVQFMTAASSLGGGEKVPTLVRSGLANLPVRSDLVYQVTNILPGVRWGFDIPSGSIWHADSAAAHVVAFMLLVVFTTILGYGLAIVAAGQTRAYAVLKYFKDGYKLSDEEPLFAAKSATPEPEEVGQEPTPE
jgi:hypothetical protein